MRAEATQARATGRLIPAMIEPCKRPIMFELTHTADLTGWVGGATDPVITSYSIHYTKLYEAALLAGRMPKTMPMNMEKRQEPATAHQGTEGGGKSGINPATP